MLLDIPQEILLEIFFFVDSDDWFQIKSTSKKLCEVIDTNKESLAKAYCSSRFQIDPQWYDKKFSSSTKILQDCSKMIKGLCSWIGLGTQYFTQPYDMQLSAEQISRPTKGKHTIGGTCSWPSLHGATTFDGIVQDKFFEFTERRVIHGDIMVPNYYKGFRFGNVIILRMSFGSRLSCCGLVFGVMEGVRKINPLQMLFTGKVWKGQYLAPNPNLSLPITMVNVQMKILRVDAGIIHAEMKYESAVLQLELKKGKNEYELVDMKQLPGIKLRVYDKLLIGVLTLNDKDRTDVAIYVKPE